MHRSNECLRGMYSPIPIYWTDTFYIPIISLFPLPFASSWSGLCLTLLLHNPSLHCLSHSPLPTMLSVAVIQTLTKSNLEGKDTLGSHAHHWGHQGKNSSRSGGRNREMLDCFINQENAPQTWPQANLTEANSQLKFPLPKWLSSFSQLATNQHTFFFPESKWPISYYFYIYLFV